MTFPVDDRALPHGFYNLSPPLSSDSPTPLKLCQSHFNEASREAIESLNQLTSATIKMYERGSCMKATDSMADHTPPTYDKFIFQFDQRCDLETA